MNEKEFQDEANRLRIIRDRCQVLLDETITTRKRINELENLLAEENDKMTELCLEADELRRQAAPPKYGEFPTNLLVF